MRLVSEGALERGLRRQPEFRRAMKRIGDAVIGEARSLAAEEGVGPAYARKLDVDVEDDGDVVASAEADDARAVETGTPEIRPRRGKVLVFKAKTGLAHRPSGKPGSPAGGTVFAAFVKAAPAHHIMERAAKRLAARSDGLSFRRGRGAAQ